MDLIARESQAFSVPVPWLLGICFDCTASIDRRQFETAQKELINFLLNTHVRAAQSGRPDLVSLTAFKAKREAFGPPQPLDLVDMRSRPHVMALAGWIASLKNDGGGTALYDAIRIASAELQRFDQRLPLQFLKVVMAITDGQDTCSEAKLRDLAYFNSTDLHLAVIGVGSSATREISQLAPYATSTHTIDNFGDLYRALTVSIEGVIQRQTRFRF